MSCRIKEKNIYILFLTVCTGTPNQPGYRFESASVTHYDSAVIVLGCDAGYRASDEISQTVICKDDGYTHASGCSKIGTTGAHL